MTPNKSNYNNGNNDVGSSPFKKGKFSDIVKPIRSRHMRVAHKSDKDIIDALTIDMVQVLADAGICLKNIYTIAKKLVQLGWVQQQKIVKDSKNKDKR